MTAVNIPTFTTQNYVAVDNVDNKNCIHNCRYGKSLLIVEKIYMKIWFFFYARLCIKIICIRNFWVYFIMQIDIYEISNEFSNQIDIIILWKNVQECEWTDNYNTIYNLSII